MTIELDKRLFPDGLKTSGQHPPDANKLFSYSEFPEQVSGPALWRAEESDNDKWKYVFNGDELEELGDAADTYLRGSVPLTGMTKDAFPLPKLGPVFEQIRETIINGRGFILFKGLPVNEWGLEKSACCYMGLGAHFGYFLSQNRHGHVLGHVKDVGDDATQTHTVRIYRTTARQYFHVDAGDLVGLLCIARALEGGESDIASTHHVFNTLQREHPEAVETLTKPIWYFDRKGEVSEGEEPYYRSAVFFLEPSGQKRVWAKFDPMNVTSLSRFHSGPNAIPPLSEEQLHAMKCLEDTAAKLSLHMVLEPGDIQLISNQQVFHARTAYKDYPPGTVDENGKARVRRHLMRLWLATPEEEGGWRLPFHDSHMKKRGGIQVNDNPPTCPLDAE